MPPIHFHATGEELRRCTPAVPVPNRELSLANQVVPLPDFDLMPFKHFLKSREQLEKVEWLTTLYNYLLTLNKSVSPHLNMVNGDYNHRYLMENWIVAAMMILNPPLRNVLVLSLDKELCDYIATGIHTCSLGVTCIVASVNSTFSSEAGEYWITGTMTRSVTLSLINYWGYDVATYDSDAVILKNPETFYRNHPNTHLVSSMARESGENLGLYTVYWCYASQSISCYG